VRVTGAGAGDVYAVSLARDSAGRAGPIVRRLAAQGASRSTGSLVLRDVERRELLAGRLVLALFTGDQPGAVTRTAAPLSPRRANE
jgi:hypothetical protein